MSILYECGNGWVISHSKFITNIYQSTTKQGVEMKLAIREDLFDILHPYKRLEFTRPPNKRKHRQISKNLDPETIKVKENFTAIIDSARRECPTCFTDEPLEYDDSSNSAAKMAAESCSSASMPLRDLGILQGGNSSENSLQERIFDCDVLIPPFCRFHCGDVRKTLPNITQEQFDFIIIDPPWWNKFIRKKKSKAPESSYDMLYNEEVVNLPLKELLSASCVVAVWCTNCTNHEKCIKDQMFPAWGVTYAATWFWIKVTKSSSPVCPFTEKNGKQPFERIIIGINDASSEHFTIPDDRIIVSVPSALHSHKPPLNDLMKPYITAENPNFLEIFARYLLPNTTSLGKEPVRWQHRSLYIEEDSIKNQQEDH